MKRTSRAPEPAGAGRADDFGMATSVVIAFAMGFTVYRCSGRGRTGRPCACVQSLALGWDGDHGVPAFSRHSRPPRPSYLLCEIRPLAGRFNRIGKTTQCRAGFTLEPLRS
jgi:hypothetical protein